MPKQSKQALQNTLASRSPLGQRQAIVPVNILEEAALTPSIPNGKTEREKDTEKAINLNERKKRAIKANAISTRKERTAKPSTYSVRQNRTILAEPERPETVRDSYEAYVDQLEIIETLQTLYREKTGRPLSKSRVIREALANFLPLALDAYKDEQPSPQKTTPQTESEVSPLSGDLVPLQAFADQHSINRNEAWTQWKQGHITRVEDYLGQNRLSGVVLNAKGRRDFWIQFQKTPSFRACDDCPHTQQGSE